MTDDTPWWPPHFRVPDGALRPVADMHVNGRDFCVVDYTQHPMGERSKFVRSGGRVVRFEVEVAGNRRTGYRITEARGFNETPVERWADDLLTLYALICEMVEQ